MSRFIGNAKDRFCNVEAQFIYMMLFDYINVTDEDTDVVGCGTDWNINHATGNCYKFLDERRTWEQARDRCAAEEGVLSPIISAEEQLFIFGNFNYCLVMEVT